MNFIFRAIKSLKERKGKTFITFLVMLTVSLVILASFSIQSATEVASVMARQKLGATVNLVQDMEKAMGESSAPGARARITKVPVPLSYVDELKNAEYVKDYSISSKTGANLDEELLAVGQDEEDAALNNAMASKGGAMGDVSITGLNNMENDSKVLSGAIELIEGRELTDDDSNKNVVLIEENFATLNSLKVGDNINLNSAIDELSVECEIVGIFKDSSDVDESAFRMTSQLPYNNIYTPYTLANTLKGEDYANGVDSISFYLDDPINIGSFIENANSTNIDFNTFKLDANGASYDAMVGPIENVASFSKTTLIMVTIFGGVILTLIVMLSIKDRVNEIGILMALGEKKFKIVYQLLTEVVLVLILSLTVSSFLGGPISKTVGNTLIQKEISVSEESEISNGFKGGKATMMSGMSVNDVEVVDELDINVSSKDLAKMSACSLGVSILATILPASFIMRLNPKTILSRHN